MEKSRLFKLLQTLSKQEWKDLRKFLLSPFFNRRTDLVQFFDILGACAKNEKALPGKEAIFQKIYPGEAFDDQRIRLLMSLLFQLTQQFLAINAFLDDPVAYPMRLANIYRHRNLSDHFSLTWREMEEKHRRQPLRHADFFEEAYRIYLEKYRSEWDARSQNHQDLQALSNGLDTAYLTRKLWQSCFLLSHQAVSNAGFDFGLLDAALVFAEQSPLLETPAAAIYFHCYRALTNPAEKSHFQAFKNLVLQNGDLFPLEEVRDLYVLAINFCIRRYNEGSLEYLDEQFDFYKEGFAKGYFLVEGALSRFTYQNAVTIGLVKGELVWVENFVHRYRENLQEPYRESVFSFNLARLEYQRHNFGTALQLLQKAEYKDILLNLAAKTLQLKIFFELDEYDLLEAHLQAFKTFIQRKKGMGYHRENYLSLLHFTRKLLEVNPFNKEERASLRADIEAGKAVAEKEWLLEQVK